MVQRDIDPVIRGTLSRKADGLVRQRDYLRRRTEKWTKEEKLRLLQEFAALHNVAMHVLSPQGEDE